MRKTTLKRIVIQVPAVLLVILVALTLFGRSVGRRPLPWHTAWMAAFGQKGWQQGWQWSIRNGMTKQQVRDALGDPESVYFDRRFFNAGGVDLMELRPEEIWYYDSPFSEHSGPGVRFRHGRVVGH